MNTAFFILTIFFIIAAVAMVLIILVQRPSGGGLAGAFGGAGGSSSDTVFGGRVGDALTTMTVIAFLLYLSLAIALNKVDSNPVADAGPSAAETAVTTPPDADTSTQSPTPLISTVGEDGTIQSVPITPIDPPTSGSVPGRVAPEDEESIREVLESLNRQGSDPAPDTADPDTADPDADAETSDDTGGDGG